MDTLAAIGLDIAAVSIVLYCATAAAKKGFLRTVIQMVAYVAIVMAASFLSRAAAPVIYDRVVEPALLQNARQEDAPAQERKPNAALVSAQPRGALSFLDGLDLEGLDLNEFDLDGLDLDNLLPEGADPQELAEDFIDDLADATLRPLMINAITMISFVLLFTVLSVVANVLLSALGIIRYLPVVGTLNALLGGVVGILQGLLLVWVLAILLQGIFHLYPDGWWIFRPEIIDRSYIFRYFMNPGLLKNL